MCVCVCVQHQRAKKLHVVAAAMSVSCLPGDQFLGKTETLRPAVNKAGALLSVLRLGAALPACFATGDIASRGFVMRVFCLFAFCHGPGMDTDRSV